MWRSECALRALSRYPNLLATGLIALVALIAFAKFGMIAGANMR